MASSHRLSDDAYHWWVWAIRLGNARAGSLFPWAERARAWLADPDARVDIVTPVRDPVARNVSKYFFERGRGMGAAEPRIASHTVDDATAHFYHALDHREPLRWFDEEVRVPLGIDLFGEHAGPEAYDPAAGHGTIEAGRVRMLLIDANLPDEEKAARVAGFLGVGGFEIPRLNAVAEPGDASLYRAFLKEARLMPEYLDWMYESRFARRFFTPGQIERMRARWSGEESAAARAA